MTGPVVLKSGSHGNDPEGPCCLVEHEVVHVLGREVKADSDPTICPVIQAMATGLNDAYPDSPAGDARRTSELLRFEGRLAHSKSTPEVERRRSHLVCDWLIRTYTPAWFRLVPSLVGHAEALTALPEITDGAAAESALPTISAARSAADSAAYSAARSAAFSAAYSAAFSAAYSAAFSAAFSAAYSAARSAAFSAAYSAAFSAARSAAYSAADSAADSALKPTADHLRSSAIDLLERMLAVTS